MHWLGHYLPCEKWREDSLATDALGQFFQPFLVERPARVGREFNQILMTEEANGLGAGFPQEGHVVKAQKDFRTVVRSLLVFNASGVAGEHKLAPDKMERSAESFRRGWPLGSDCNDLGCGTLDNLQTLREQRGVAVPERDVVGAC